MATSSLPPLHNNGDVEKGAASYHNNGDSTLHHAGHANNGVVGNTSTNSYSSAQDGGAPFNLRNVTPGGHPLDRVRTGSRPQSMRIS